MTHALSWHGCYAESWQGLVTPATFTHPAKFSRSLIHRIYRHLKTQGLAADGATILDPFGGCALGALDAMTYGYHWLGCELEPKFHALGVQNLALWRQQYGFSTGALVCGDSRQLRTVLSGPVQAMVTSPPFLDGTSGHDAAFDATASEYASRKKAGACTKAYGTTPGQLGIMPAGALVTSPPYAETALSGGATTTGQGYTQGERCLHGYGTTAGNLGNLKAGAMVTSPPYAEGCKQNGHDYHPDRMTGSRRGYLQSDDKQYGTTPHQLGNATPDTFWQAAAAILTECHALLAPHSPALFVLKDYVRQKQRVPFYAQWRACCEATGYTFVEEIHAMLVERLGTQPGLFGGEETPTVERKSFFRRLAEKKGSPRIDWETVLVMRRCP